MIHYVALGEPHFGRDTAEDAGPPASNLEGGTLVTRCFWRDECDGAPAPDVWDEWAAIFGCSTCPLRKDAGPPASTDAVSPDERARGTSQAADTTAEAARALGLTPRPIP
jgi:hypothetical protein